MKQLLIYYSFILASLMTFAGFTTANSIPELISAVFFFPLAVYFASLVIPKTKHALTIKVRPTPPTLLPLQKDPLPPEADLAPAKPKLDLDRRKFLKLISSAGLSVFLLSVFTKKAQGAFFGSIPGPGTVALKDTSGTQIDPAEKHPTDGYKISRLDDSSPAYYGFTNKDEGWFILKEDSSGNYTYEVGSGTFTTNWTNRATLSYGEYFEKF